MNSDKAQIAKGFKRFLADTENDAAVIIVDKKKGEVFFNVATDDVDGCAVLATAFIDGLARAVKKNGIDKFDVVFPLMLVSDAIKEDKITFGDVLDILSEGRPHTYAAVTGSLHAGTITSVQGQGIVSAGASDDKKLPATWNELFNLTASAFVRTLIDSGVCKDEVMAMSFVTASLNSYLTYSLADLKARGIVSECFDFADAGADPFIFMDESNFEDNDFEDE